MRSVWETPGVVANLADLVADAAAARPAHPALVVGDRTQTWSQVEAAVDVAAAGFQGLGLRPGDRVALALTNSPEFVAAYFGALRAGLVAVPVNTGSTQPEVEFVLTDSGASAVVFDRAAAASVRAAVSSSVRPIRVVVGAPAPGEVASSTGATP